MASLLAASLALAAMRVCGRCGYENPDGPTHCTHCNSALPATRPAAPRDAVPRETGGKGALVDAALLAEEVTLARTYFQEGNFELARQFSANAVALDLLSDRTENPQRSAVIADLLERCRKRTRLLARTCGECNGSGTSSIEIRGLDGARIERQVHGRTCTGCRGEGYVVANATMAEVMQVKGQALRTYTTLQRGRQYVAVGNAWLPEALRDQLTVEQTAAILCATASPCADCLGTGRLDCDECRGVGRVRCPNRGCTKGRIETKRENTLIKGDTTRMEKCPICGGTGQVGCEECLGNGTKLCDECLGKGERALCRKCNGMGLTSCRKCKGQGTYRGATCPECNGEGAALCRSCMGDGRDR